MVSRGNGGGGDGVVRRGYVLRGGWRGVVAPGAAPAARAKCSRFETVLTLFTLFVNGHGPLLYCLSRLGYFFVSTSKRIDYCNVGSRIFIYSNNTAAARESMKTIVRQRFIYRAGCYL